MGGFAARVHGTRRRDNGPGFQCPEVGNHELRAIGHHQGYPLAFSHSQRLQAGRATVDVVEKMVIRKPPAEVNQSGAPVELPGGPLQDLRQRALGKLEPDWRAIPAIAQRGTIGLSEGCHRSVEIANAKQ